MELKSISLKWDIAKKKKIQIITVITVNALIQSFLKKGLSHQKMTTQPDYGKCFDQRLASCSIIADANHTF